jgi:hypothetical protein
VDLLENVWCQDGTSLKAIIMISPRRPLWRAEDGSNPLILSHMTLTISQGELLASKDVRGPREGFELSKGGAGGVGASGFFDIINGKSVAESDFTITRRVVFFKKRFTRREPLVRQKIIKQREVYTLLL